MLVRTFVSFALLAVGAVSALAQKPVTVAIEKDQFAFINGKVLVDTANDEATQSVKSALNLSDVQVNALKTLLTQRGQNSEQVAQSMLESHQKLEDLLSQTNPNATEIGNAFLAVLGIEAQMKATDQKFQTDFRALLSSDQRAALDRLTASAAFIGSLQALGILEAGNMSMHTFEMHAGPGDLPAGVVTSHAIRIEHH